MVDLDKNKNMEKFQTFYQNHGLTPLEKSLLFYFFNFLILESKNAFFPSKILSNRFSCLILPKIKRWKNFKFLTKTMDQPLWKNPSFSIFLFLLFLHFYNLKTLFSFLEYGRTHFPGLFFFKKRWKKFKFLTKTMDQPLWKNT